MSNYLSEVYQEMGEKLVIEETYFETDSRFFNLERILRSLNKGNFLDMGCGQGALLQRLSDYHQPYGLEFDSSAANKTREKGIPCVNVDLNSLNTIPYEQQFDCIVCSEVCEHLLNPRNAFRLARQKLAPKGVFIVTVPNALPLCVRLNSFLGKSSDWLHYPSLDTEQTGHLRFYTIESLGKLALQEGFSIQKIRGVSWRFNGGAWPRICYWIARMNGKNALSKNAMLVDDFMSKKFPSLSPGLMAIFSKN